MNPIDFILWYLNFIMTHMHIILLIAVLYVAYEIRKDFKHRRNIEHWTRTMAYASKCGISYQEADERLIDQRPK